MFIQSCVCVIDGYSDNTSSKHPVASMSFFAYDNFAYDTFKIKHTHVSVCILLLWQLQCITHNAD
jgi:hypothetical protein